MKAMLVVLALIAMFCTAATTLGAVVFCLAMGANAKPPEIRALKFWVLGLTLLGLVGISIGIYLLRVNQPGWGAGVSVSPTFVIGVITLVVLLK